MMSLQKLISLRTRRPIPQRYLRRPRRPSPSHGSHTAFPSPFPIQNKTTVNPPQTQPHHPRGQKPTNGQNDPMPPHPKHQPRIFPMPTTPTMPPEKRPRLPIVFIRHEHPHPPHLAAVPPSRACGGEDSRDGITDPAPALVFLPDYGEEKGPGAVHDGYVGEFPVAVVGD